MASSTVYWGETNTPSATTTELSDHCTGVGAVSSNVTVAGSSTGGVVSAGGDPVSVPLALPEPPSKTKLAVSEIVVLPFVSWPTPLTNTPPVDE